MSAFRAHQNVTWLTFSGGGRGSEGPTRRPSPHSHLHLQDDAAVMSTSLLCEPWPLYLQAHSTCLSKPSGLSSYAEERQDKLRQQVTTICGLWARPPPPSSFFDKPQLLGFSFFMGDTWMIPLGWQPCKTPLERAWPNRWKRTQIGSHDD